MSEFLKPDNLNVVWASGGDRLFPGTTKYASGWGVEIPPRQYFNEIDYKQDQMLAHINQRGIAEWDVDTEYQANKSYTQDSTGTIHRCILTHTGQNPELDVSNTYWEIAFANAGDFFTQTESDARYAQVSNNGSDFTASTFRTNLSLYSKTETYNKTEVDGKTAVASTLQSQEQTSNNTLLTPLRLRQAFQGDNSSLTASGFMRFPGGLIMQWGTTSTTASGVAVDFQIPFTSAVFAVTANVTTSSTSGVDAVECLNQTLTGFSAATASGPSTARFIAIGI